MKNKYYPQETEAEIQHKNLINQYYPDLTQAEINEKNAIAALGPEQLKELMIKNEWAPKLNQAQIDSSKALSNYRNMGGGVRGVGQQELMGLQRQLQIQ